MVTHCCLWWVLTLLTQVTAKWGTYRPGLYFGIQSDSPDTLPSGLMWFTPSSWTKMRHFCEDDDTIPFFGWLKHDGDSFGLQTIEDELNKVQLTTVFLKDGGLIMNSRFME
jgi:mannosyl-oligosaccharide glucosidase